MRNVAKILAIVSSKCEHSSGCHLCSDYNSNVAAVDAIPCILVSALQTYHRLTVDVNHFLASANTNQASHLSKNQTFSNLSGIEQEVRIITSSKYLEIWFAFAFHILVFSYFRKQRNHDKAKQPSFSRQLLLPTLPFWRSRRPFRPLLEVFKNHPVANQHQIRRQSEEV